MQAATSRTSAALAALSILAVIVPAQAQDAASAVTDEQIKSYQVGLEVGCKRVSRKRGDSIERAESYCGCVMKVLQDNASRGQWQLAAFAALHGHATAEATGLSEHTLKFQACKENAP